MRLTRTIYGLFIGYLTKQGNKIHAKNIVNSTFGELTSRFNTPAFSLLKIILKRTDSVLEIKTLKKRKSIHVIPFAINYSRRTYLVVKKLFDSVTQSGIKKSFKDRLVSELSNILSKNKYSKTVQRNKEILKQALFYRSNSHFRW